MSKTIIALFDKNAGLLQWIGACETKAEAVHKLDNEVAINPHARSFEETVDSFEAYRIDAEGFWIAEHANDPANPPVNFWSHATRIDD
jgi:hypothetical protein